MNACRHFLSFCMYDYSVESIEYVSTHTSSNNANDLSRCYASNVMCVNAP